MSILATDIKFYLSGGASNADPNAALGGLKSSVEVVDDTLNNLFDDVSGAEHAAGDTEYRCIFVKNNSAEDAKNVKIYLQSNTPAADSAVTIGLDLGAPSDTADTIVNEHTAPDPAVTFSTAADYDHALNLGYLDAGQSAAVWVKRVISAGNTAQANDNFVIKVSVDSL